MIVDRPRTVPGVLVDTPPRMAVTAGALGEGKPDEVVAPGLLDSLGAFFRHDNLVASLIASDAIRTSNAPDPNFGGAWEQIKGTDREQYWDRFVHVRNQAQFDAVSRDIDEEIEARKIMDATPFATSIPMMLAANIVDPTIFIPGGAFVRGVKGGWSIARSALNVGLATGAAVTAQEAGLHMTQQLRSPEESAVAVGSSVLLGGLIGAAGAKLMSRAEWADAVNMMDDELRVVVADNTPFPGPVGASVGAARVDADMDALTIAGRAAGKTASASAFINPGLRLAHSASARVRETAYNLFEMTQYLRGADQGIAAPRAVETLRKEWNAGLMQAADGLRSSFSDYRKRVGRGAMDRAEFRIAVGKAMRRGDVDAVPEVQAAAAAWRKHVFEPLKEAAIAAKLLPEDVSVDTAISYFSRMYNRTRLNAEEHLFKNTVTEWLQTQTPRWIREFEDAAAKRIAEAEAKVAAWSDEATGKAGKKAAKEDLEKIRAEIEAERAERFEDIPGRIREITDEVFNKLTGRAGDSIRPGHVTVEARGPLKARTFMIPDELIERWLESDIDVVGRQYHRIMSSDVELAKKFGSVDMAEQVKAIREDYAKLRQGVTDPKKLKKLADAEKADVRDLTGIRDLLRGTYDLAGWEHDFGRMARVANMLNYIRSMGQVVLASLPEAYRTAFVHGLRPMMGVSMKALRRADGFKMSVKEAKLAGNITERALANRLATLAEIGDFYTSRGPVEKFMANMTEVASSWNGIRLWTDAARMIAGVATQDRILATATRFAKASARDKRYLAYLGVGEGMASRIAKQFDEFGEVADGVHVANTEQWTDIDARTAYRAALNKDLDTQVVTRSVADVPLFANTPLGRLIFQFNTFNLASHQRVLLRGLQEGPARFVSGAIALTAIGMLVTKLQALAANRETPSFSENPGWWIAEGLDRGGLILVPMQLANAMEKLTGFAGVSFNPIKAPLKAFDEGQTQSMRLNNRNLLSLAGPSAGLVEDALVVGVGIPLRIAADQMGVELAGEPVTQGQKNAAERLLPFNSYLGLRQMMRYVVNPPAGQ